jgi:predicted Zn-dependent protease
VNRSLKVLVIVAALVLGWVGYSTLSSQPSTASVSLAPKVEGRKIYFVPIEAFPVEQLEPLVRYYHQKYNLEIAIVSSIPVDPSARDESRRQLMAEKLAASLRNGDFLQASDTNAILIGFTSEDIYPTSQNWQFAFGWRIASMNTAVVSTARMNLHYLGQPLRFDLSQARLRKVVTKDIGILYYGLPQSKDAQSVLYNQILGIQELDRIGEEF